MGLDMYLTARRWVSEYSDPELHAALSVVTKSIRGGKPVQEITVEAMYWRKANQIHAWFVDNVQNGQDDCRPYYVMRSQLQELKDLVDQCLADRTAAPLLLPPQAGSFFGGLEIDDWYWQDLERTSQELAEVLLMDDRWEFYYRSSW